MQKKYIYIGVAVFLAAGFLAWLFIESSKPLPGEKINYDCSNFTDFSKLGDTNNSDKCRVHIPAGTEVKYSSNPPVFGPHYADWVRAGVYTEAKDDRNLVHSLEHGYVILSYKCNLESSDKSQESSGNKIATDSPSPRNDDKSECDSRKSQLEEIFNKKGKRKLIVVPRPNLDTNFALTAWQYLDKFDPSTGSGLSVSDKERIENFIDAHLDNGPERTME